MKNLFGALAAATAVFLLAMPVRGELPEFPDSRLTIPWSDFRTIIEKLSEMEAEGEAEEPVPAPFVINSASYEGELLDNGSARFDLKMELVVLEPEEWVTIPVIPEGPAVASIKLDQKPVLSVLDNGVHKILLQGEGPYTLTVRFYVDAENRRGPESLRFRTIETPVTSLSFIVNKPGLDIEARPSTMSRVNEYQKSTRLESVLAPTESMAITWTRKVEAEKAELRVNTQVSTRVTLGEHLCRVHSQVDYEILHRSVTGFKLSLPADAEVVDVSGKGIADWKANKDGDDKTIEVTLGYEASGDYSLQIDYELELLQASAKFDVPELKTMDTTRESGHIGVMAATNIEVRVKSVSGVVSVDASDLPPEIKRTGLPVIHAFKYLEHPWQLRLETVRHEDVEVLSCTVDRAVLKSFVSRDGEFVTRAVYTLRNNREQFIRVKLPEDARLFSTFLEGAPVRPSQDKSNNVLVPLEKSTGDSGKARSFQVEIIYMQKLDKLDKDKGTLKLEAPAADQLTNLLKWKIYLPEEFRYEVEDKSLQQKERKEPLIAGSESFVKKQESILDNRISAQPSSARRSRTPQVNVYKYKTKKSYTPVILPVRFLLPESGVVLDFYKAVVQEGENNSVTLLYDRPSVVWPKVKVVLIAAAGVLFLIIITWIIVRAEKVSRRRDAEVSK